MSEAPLPLDATPPQVSLVVPLYNEADNVAPLVQDVFAAMAAQSRSWELVLVDDGSADDTPKRLTEQHDAHPDRVRVLTLQRNFGQTAAMQAGIDVAQGEVVVTLDGDLQNDPADIPAMVDRLLAEDLDLLAGWRKNRKDNRWLRTIPSRIANRLIGKATKVYLHDYGCSLKVFRGSVIRGVRLYGEMHRFIPAWISVYTSPNRIREQVVNHRPRVHGVSKYGLSRTFRVIVDLLAVYFFLRFLTKPGHFFGRIGLAFGALGGAALGYLFLLKLFVGEDIGGRPLLLAGIMLVLMAVQFLTTGVLAELLTRTYFATSRTCPYVIRYDSHAPDLAR
ncbi:MAG: glycosyltransferase family 2 protein [Chromatiales bacterium]|nr:glycosyltransferase family 2 protein [Chromatiales bacterium]